MSQPIVTAFDQIVITVPHLATAIGEYRQLLGIEPLCPDPLEGEQPRSWFVLPNTLIELVQSSGDAARISGIVFAAPGVPDAASAVGNARGLDIRLCDGQRSAELRRRQSGDGPAGLWVDHVVLRSGDASACIELFGHRLGIRLALDQSVPAWGGRMLFFRVGKLTLEVIEAERERVEQDYFWGIAYRCGSLARAAGELAGRGVSLSGIRAGRKAGTRVATVKSHTLGIPTLLLETV